MENHPPTHLMDEGNLFVVAAPSGTGKTTLVKALVESLTKLAVSISHTTRPMRPNEKDGVNYYFVEQASFERSITANEFLEYAKIFDHYYGTSRKMVEQTLQKGIDVILEIDWQGYHQIRESLPKTIGIFILPPSFDDLRVRLIKRNQDHPDIIARRLADVKETVAHMHEFDYVVINDDFSRALLDLQTIIGASRLLYRRQVNRFRQMISHLTNPAERI